MVFSPFSRLIVFLSVQRLTSLFRTYSHHMQKLRVFAFLWANTLALGSCLCDNRSKTRQRQAVVLSSIPPYKPPRKPLRPLRPLRLCVPFSHSLLSLNTEYGGQRENCANRCTRCLRLGKENYASNNNPRTLSVSPFSFTSAFRRRL